MDVKKEYKDHLMAQKIVAVLMIIIGGAILVHILYRALTVGIQNISLSNWIIGGVCISAIVFEIFSFRFSAKKLKELE